MKKRHGMSSPQVLLRYTLLQIPGYLVLIAVLGAAMSFNLINFRLAVIIGIIWLIKDAVLYPFLWRAFAPSTSIIDNKIVGLNGAVIEPLAPTGYIRVAGELWRARPDDLNTTVGVGRHVRVIDSEGLTLIVRPLSADTDLHH